MLPTVDYLHQILRYEPETGKLFWLPRPESMFVGGKYPAQRRCASWNSRLAGKEAFTCIGSHGYREGSIDGRHYLGHRVIWALVHGVWPSDEIDHDDGDRTNNRQHNFKPATHAQNMRNVAGKSNNTSGFTGVSWRPNRSKWRARLMIDGKEKSLGHFDQFEDAIEARRVALQENGFSPRHGELKSAA